MAKETGSSNGSKAPKRRRPRWTDMDLLEFWMAAAEWGQKNPEANAREMMTEGMTQARDANKLRPASEVE